MRDEAWDAARAAEEEAGGLTEAMRGLQASVQAEWEACEVMQGQLEESKGEHGHLQ